MNRKPNNIIVRNAEIDYLNFRGKANTYNAEGNRNFCLVLDDIELIQKMIDDGWNMKPYKPSVNEETGEASKYYTQINVAYGSDFYPDPEIIYVSDGGRKQNIIPEDILDGETSPDNLYFDKIDLVIRIRERRDKKTGEFLGRKGYLQQMYAWLYENDLKKEYDDLLYGEDAEDEEVPFEE